MTPDTTLMWAIYMTSQINSVMKSYSERNIVKLIYGF